MKTFCHIVLVVVALCISSAPVAYATSAITQTTYNNLVRFAHFSSAAYFGSNVCPNPQGSTVISWFSDAGTDTQGYVAVDSTNEQIVVAFRGSTSLEDFEEDADILQTGYSSPISGQHCLLCMVHSGFFGAWNAVKTTVLNTVQAQHTAHPTFSVVVTGHSLGGALTPLAALSIKGLGLGVVIQVYSYGEPRVGDSLFANFVDNQLSTSNVFRGTHTTDSVPQLIPKSVLYTHHSSEYFITADPSSLATTVKCVGQEDSTCNDATAVSWSSTMALIGSSSPHHTYFGVGMGDQCV